MYYEDLFTLPDKKLPYNAAAKTTNMHIKKVLEIMLVLLVYWLISTVVLFITWSVQSQTILNQWIFKHDYNSFGDDVGIW